MLKGTREEEEGVGEGMEKACQVHPHVGCFRLLCNYIAKEGIRPSGSGARLPVFK